MLTARENFMETIKGGRPERFVNQFEALAIQAYTPKYIRFPEPEYGRGCVCDDWGIYWVWPEGTPGNFPVHDEAHLVIKDITRWKDYVKVPDVMYSEEEWAPFVEEANKVNRREQLVTAMIWPGLFETCQDLMKIDVCLAAFYEEPEIMHEIIDCITEYQLAYSREIIRHIHPDALYRHDDWGTQISTFMSKTMFDEFILEPTKKIYDFWRKNGVEIIIHHSDSFAETLVPDMVEMGIDVWQGAISTNNLPKIVKEYQGKLTIMGGIDNGKVDVADWTPEKVRTETKRVIDWVDSPYFIPCGTMGEDGSTYKGVYDEVSAEIDHFNRTEYLSRSWKNVK